MPQIFQKNVLSKVNQVSLRNLVFIVFCSTFFNLAYAQSPLYTSNQNQYFLHGLAKADFGYLHQDWLANTLDPTPVFSGLVYLTYRILPWPPIFYLYFAILAGIFIFSILGIASEVFNLKAEPSKRWLFVTALIAINSAALRYLVVRIFDVDWAYLFDGGVAGQRLLGSVLQPSAFGVLLVLSIALFLRHKYAGAVACLVLAPTFHPTYLLSAAVLTLVYMGILLAEKKELRGPLVLGVAALIGVIPILVHTLSTFGSTDPYLTDYSRDLLINFRIPHHAIPAEWLDASVALKTIFVLGAVLLLRVTTATVTSEVTVTSKFKLFHILLWSSVVAISGTVAQIITGSKILALLFPWRLSTWLVPISVGVITVWTLNWLWQRSGKRIPDQIVIRLSIGLSILLAGMGFSKSVLEYREKHTSSDRLIMAYVGENKSPGDVYAIPLDMQDFRLVTGAPAYVEFKSIPYLDADVKEWFRRVSLVGELYRAPYVRAACDAIERLHAEGVTHVVLPYDYEAAGCENLKLLFQDFEKYEVYFVIETK
jgi:hypothetical protein